MSMTPDVRIISSKNLKRKCKRAPTHLPKKVSLLEQRTRVTAYFLEYARPETPLSDFERDTPY